MANLYVLESGVLQSYTNTFALSNEYFGSYKKALAYAERVLSENFAKEVVDSFDGFPNLQEGYLFAKDYIGENGKYKARVLITKQNLR